MSVSFKPACPLQTLRQIEDTFPSGATQLHRRRFERIDGSVYLLAWVDGIAVGHALVTPALKYPEIQERFGTIPEENGLDVSDTYRRQGIGRALMEAARAEAVRLGCDRLGLAVEPDNEPAIRLYEVLGFEQTHLDVVDVWTWLDEDGSEHEERDACTYWVQVIST